MDDYSDVNDIIIKRLKAKLAAYNKAADKFIEKVRTGKARSVETYNDLVSARSMPEDVAGYKL
jgi:hypothetical protein